MEAANLYERNGIWYVRLQIDGRDRRLSLKTTSKLEAEHRVAIAIARLTEPTHPAHRRNRQLALAKQIALHTRASSAGNFIYFVQHENGGPIKIGRSQSPSKRIEQLQCSSSGRLKVLCCIPAPVSFELKIHQRFATLRVHREWFQPSPGLRKFIRQILAAREEAVARTGTAETVHRRKSRKGIEPHNSQATDIKSKVGGGDGIRTHDTALPV